ncbi:MAG: aspartate kinase [Candidatus Kapaibacterium sp.]
MSDQSIDLGTSPLVLKFGGTSVRDAAAMRRVVAIVAGEIARDRTAPGPRAPMVVVTSACAGVTDMLLECARGCGGERPEEALALVAALRERHLGILDDLDSADAHGGRDDLRAMLDEIERLVRGVAMLGELTPRTTDLFASYGERLSSLLLTAAFRFAGLRAALADSRQFIITDDAFINAVPLMAEIDRRAHPAVDPLMATHDVVVAQGFIGSTIDGITTTIGRGGGDYSGALIGAALGAREIQIWTDVSGILTADPRLVPNARVVPEVTFTEARELAYFGAKVIHPDTILPAVARNIPVVIRNSMAPADPGTRIMPDGTPIPSGIHSITMKKGMTALKLSPRDPRDGSAPVERALSLFAEHGVPLYCGLLAESRGLAITQGSAFNDILLAAVESTCRVTVDEEMALLCMTGAALHDVPAALSEPLAALEGITVALVAAGTSEHIMLIGVPESRANEALSAVHRRLFEGVEV